jgi:predicted DNA-binding protein
MDYESLQQAKLFHQSNEQNWAGEALAEYKHQIKENIKTKNVKTILDYGCGKAVFHKYFFKNYDVFCYDPAVNKFSTKPESGRKFDLLLCIDVMEHVQEDKVDEVLTDIFSYSNNVFLTITCYPATQILLNGKNAHYCIKNPEWWQEKLNKYEGKYNVIYQTKSYRSKIIKNKEEWVPSEETLERIRKGKKNVTQAEIDRAKEYGYI